MRQNVSSAVMAQRRSKLGPEVLDFFPTPPWATRALCEHVLFGGPVIHSQGRTAWDPACGRLDMVRPLSEAFDLVVYSDVHDYGVGAPVVDFLDRAAPDPSVPHGIVDWVITNPPFRLAAEFVERGLEVATEGVAMLARLQFLESISRFELFAKQPPACVATFAERVPMVKGRLDPEASSATAYCWIVWDKTTCATDSLWVRIPPCRGALERPEDYAPYAASADLVDLPLLGS